VTVRVEILDASHRHTAVPRVLLLFVDGVGLGDAQAEWNPFLSASLPVLGALLDDRPITGSTAPYYGARASLVGIDAGLGVDGVPQSGTGQAALLTGANAAVLHGRHFGPWVPARLQSIVREESLLAMAVAGGRRVAFANAYPEEVLELARDGVASGEPGIEARTGDAGSGAGAAETGHDGATPGRAVRRRRRAPVFLRAGPPLAALGAGVLTRHSAALRQGDAVASEITNDGWREGLGRLDVPVIDAHHAGRNLATIAAAHDLTLFAHYATDYAGHRRSMSDAVHVLERFDAFLGGIVDSMPSDMLVFVVSDHGNVEDVRVGHTRNPALGIVAGAGHAALARRLRALTDVTPAILDLLSLPPTRAAAYSSIV
jgi:2,3-bisphosphoglycerate-independent phosphoglycerate mutase